MFIYYSHANEMIWRRFSFPYCRRWYFLAPNFRPKIYRDFKWTHLRGTNGMSKSDRRSLAEPIATPCNLWERVWLTETDHAEVLLASWLINSCAPACLVQNNLRCTFLLLFLVLLWFHPVHYNRQEICWAFPIFFLCHGISNILLPFS